MIWRVDEVSLWRTIDGGSGSDDRHFGTQHRPDRRASVPTQDDAGWAGLGDVVVVDPQFADDRGLKVRRARKPLATREIAIRSQG